MKLKFILIIINIFLGLTIYAQEVTPEVTADPQDSTPINLGFSEVNAYLETEILNTYLGEPFPVTLIVEMPSGYNIPEWRTDILGDAFQIIDSGEIDTRQQGNLQIQQQPLTVVAWELDTITTGEVFLTYQNSAGEQRRTPITSITVSVTSTRAENDVELRPLKPLIDLSYIPPYIYAIPVIILIIVIVAIRQIQFNRRVQQALAIPDSPVQRAVIELKHILDTRAPIEEVYPMIADEIRNYLTNQFHIRAIDMTTVELMNALQANPIFTDSLRSSLNDLLEQADLVKFANHRPTVQTETVINYAIRWIEQAERARIAYE